MKPGPKPDPAKPYSRYGGDLTHHGLRAKCANGHEFKEGSFRLNAASKRICLLCEEDKKTETCKNGHSRSEHADELGRCRRCNADNQGVYRLKVKYGLTPETYRGMIELQEGKCKICKEELDFSKHGGICVDHDHACCPGEKTCGKCLRGILCDQCNKLLGNARDDVEILLSAIEYLK